MTMAWASPLATTAQADGTTVLLLTQSLYDATVQTKPELAARKMAPPLVNVYSGDSATSPTTSVNLTYPTQQDVINDWPSYWYDPNDV
jgi:hypothetical protein